jgi:uncharacterized membrane protein
MKKYFITGLIILLPMALTIAIVLFIFNLLTVPFAGAVKLIFQRYDLLDKGFLFLTPDQLQQGISQLLILIFLFLATVVIGAIARGFFIHYTVSLGEAILHRIPFINSIYKTSKEVIKTMFASKTKSFKQVVMVPFPSANVYTVGLITREDLPSPDLNYKALIAVFVPTTPNPTSGFLMMYRPDEITYLDMKVEEALKFVISCGVISTPFKIGSKEEILAKIEHIREEELS